MQELKEITLNEKFIKGKGNEKTINDFAKSNIIKKAVSQPEKVSKAINKIKTDPTNRRIMMTTFDPSKVQESVLAPCHSLIIQFYCDGEYLDCIMYQRSCDVFLGVPFNIASYALLTMMVAQVTELELGDFVHTFGDAHLYRNHFEQAELQLSRQPFPLPKMKINPMIKDIFEFSYEDFELINYQAHPHIKGEVAV